MAIVRPWEEGEEDLVIAELRKELGREPKPREIINAQSAVHIMGRIGKQSVRQLNARVKSIEKPRAGGPS